MISQSREDDDSVKRIPGIPTMSQQSQSETTTFPVHDVDPAPSIPTDTSSLGDSDTDDFTDVAPAEPVTTADAAGLVDAYADDLVDSLFQGVDQLLAGDEAAITSVIEAEPELADAPEATTKPLAALSPETLGALVPMAGELELASPDDFFGDAGAEPADLDRPRTWLGKTVDRILLVMTASTVLAGGGFWWNNYQHATALRMAASTPNLQGQSNTAFLDYLQRSLDVISKQGSQTTASASQVAQLPNISTLTAAPPMMPPAPPGSTGTGGSPGPVNVIERVYIPYQTSSTPTTPQTPVAGAPAATASSTGRSTTTAAAPAANHVLVGVLELGDHSAALFNINGVSQRVYLGERVGSSNWTLVSVSNEQATIRRNGEVRSIYIGQQF